jgi:hypothetical protein
LLRVLDLTGGAVQDHQQIVIAIIGMMLTAIDVQQYAPAWLVSNPKRLHPLFKKADRYRANST